MIFTLYRVPNKSYMLLQAAMYPVFMFTLTMILKPVVRPFYGSWGGGVGGGGGGGEVVKLFSSSILTVLDGPLTDRFHQTVASVLITYSLYDEWPDLMTSGGGGVGRKEGEGGGGRGRGCFSTRSILYGYGLDTSMVVCFLYGKIHFRVLHLLCGSIAMSTKFKPTISFGRSNQIASNFAGR